MSKWDPQKHIMESVHLSIFLSKNSYLIHASKFWKSTKPNNLHLKGHSIPAPPRFPAYLLIELFLALSWSPGQDTLRQPSSLLCAFLRNNARTGICLCTYSYFSIRNRQWKYQISYYWPKWHSDIPVSVYSVCNITMPTWLAVRIIFDSYNALYSTIPLQECKWVHFSFCYCLRIKSTK